MKIASLKIGAHRYTVRRVRRPDNDPAEIDLHEGTIVVSDALTPSVTVEMVLHEALHGMIGDSGLDIDENDVDEEMVVRALAPRLAAFLKDNESAVHDLLDMLSRNTQ